MTNNGGFDRDGFLLGGTALDWKRELENIFSGVENKTDKILELLDKIRELLQKDLENGRGGGLLPPPSRRNRQGSGQPPPVGNPPPPPENQPPVNSNGNIPPRANNGSGVNGQQGNNPPPSNQRPDSPPPPPIIPPANNNNRGGGASNPPAPPRQRDSNGRFTREGAPPSGENGNAGGRQRDSNGRFTGEQRSFFERLTDKIGGFFGTVKEAMFGNTDNLDPLITATQEAADITKAIFKPIAFVFKGGKALFNLFRPKRNAEAIAWFKRLFQQLRGIRQDNANRGGTGGGTGGDANNGSGSGGFSLLTAIIPFVLPLMLIVAAGLGLAFGGAKLFGWMKDKFGGWIDDLKSSDIGKFIIEKWQGLIDGVSNVIGVTVDFVKNAKDTVTGTYDMAVQNTSEAIETTFNFIDDMKDKAKGIHSNLVDKVSSGMSYVSEKISAPTTNKKNLKNQLMVHDSFLNAGFNNEQAKALTAEVGRENGYNDKYLYGKHGDAANSKVNQGFFSWQGERKDKLVKFMQSKGLVNENGTFKSGQDSLNAQAEFAKSELSSGAYKTGNFSKAGASAESMAEGLGKGYIKWAYGQDVLKNKKPFNWRVHDAKRRGFLSTLEQQLQSKDNSTKKEADARQGMGEIPPPQKIGVKQSLVVSADKAVPLSSNAAPAVQSPLIPKMPFTINKGAAPPPIMYSAAGVSKPVMPKTQPLPIVDEKIAINTPQPIQVVARVDKGQVGQDVRNRSIAHVVTGGMSTNK